jgi:hypothetical protein
MAKQETVEQAPDDGQAPLDEQELASYLEERIKPGLNRGAIPLLARSIAREIAEENYRRDEDEDDEDDDEPTDLETGLHTLQQRLGDDWTLLYAVHGGEAWLTAESQDATQRIEAPSADVLVKVVELLKQGGGRSRQKGGS